MPRTKQDQQVSPSVRPEAELESRMAATLSAAFPNISREQLIERLHVALVSHLESQGRVRLEELLCQS